MCKVFLVVNTPFFLYVFMKGLLLTSENIDYFATYLRSDVELQERVIHFGPGVGDEKLLEVPLGNVEPHADIIITVGLRKSHLNTKKVDSDPIVGISDGNNTNLFIMWDKNNYKTQSPCEPIDGDHDDARVSSNTKVSATFKLTFTPFDQIGFCESAQEGGYINTATFNSEIDVSKPLFLTVVRDDDAREDLYFHYFMVEIFECS